MKAEWVEHTDAATGRKYYRCPAEKEKVFLCLDLGVSQGGCILGIQGTHEDYTT